MSDPLDTALDGADPFALPSFLDRRSPTRRPAPEAAGGAVKAAASPDVKPPVPNCAALASAGAAVLSEVPMPDTAPPAGDNSARAKLRSYVQRVERLRDEIAGLQGDVSEVYKEAKSDGFDVAALKAVIGERAKREKDPHKFAALTETAALYRSALEDGTELATRAGAGGAG